MLLRAVDGATAARGGKASGDALAGSIEMLEAMKRAFEAIATAKVATSAHEARGLGFLNDGDRITMNRERVLSDAKNRASNWSVPDTNRPWLALTSRHPAKDFWRHSRWACT